MSEIKQELTTRCEFLLGQLQRGPHVPADLDTQVQKIVELAQRLELQRVAGRLQGSLESLRHLQGADDPILGARVVEALRVDLDELLRCCRRWRDVLRGTVIWGSAVASLLTPFLPERLFRSWLDEADLPSPAAPGGLPAVVHVIQLVLVLVFLADFTASRRRAKRAEGISVADRLISQFLGWFCLVWLTWTALYAALSLEVVLRGWIGFAAVYPLALEAINNLTSFALLMCFAVLDQPSVEFRHGDNRDRTFRRTLALGLVTALLTTSVFGLAQHAEALFGILTPRSWLRAAQLPGALFAGIATALLVGRMDSKFLRISRIRIGVLYGYAAIQMVWPVLDSDAFPAGTLAGLYIAALIGKITLWKSVDHMLAFDERALRDYIENTQRWMAEEELRVERWRAGVPSVSNSVRQP